MVSLAQQIGADAIIGMRYDATESAQHASEVLAYGTPVKLAMVATPSSARPQTCPAS